jgi:hypothetical protein
MTELQLFENHVRNFILVDPARAKKHDGGDLTPSPLVIATPALSYQLPNANGIYIADCRVIAADSSDSRSGAAAYTNRHSGGHLSSDSAERP